MIQCLFVCVMKKKFRKVSADKDVDTFMDIFNVSEHLWVMFLLKLS